METIAGNINLVREKIAAAAVRSGRRPEDITLIAVTKTVPPERIKVALEHGIRHIGENRVQEAREKIAALAGARVSWHMIGHLQKNKVKYAVRMFDMIHSIHSLELAQVVQEQCKKINRRMSVLLEVNTSGESSKFGCAPSEALPLMNEIYKLPNLEMKGFMTIGKFTENRAEIRACFQKLRKIFEEARSAGGKMGTLTELSMGMSGDFEIAIEEGATMVRIGSAIFGPRM